MPILGQTQHMIDGTSYGFSATQLDQLGATEYTLVTLCADVSGSVNPFIRQIEDCLAHIVSACTQAPRSDHLMLRVTSFDSRIREVHGFKPITQCSSSDYKGKLRASGCTALYDAAHNVVESVATYGETLAIHDFDVNGIVFVITDGADNSSSATVSDIRASLKRCVTDEKLESMFSVLIGVNVRDKSLSKNLKNLKNDAGFDEYIELQDATSDTLQRLAHFVSRSVSLQSRALSTGQSSIDLSF